MASQVEIINVAIGRLGQDRGIAALSDASKEARTAGRVWDMCRDEVLEARVWPFALKSQALALESESPLLGWRFRYSVPNDCLVMKAVVDESGLRGARHVADLLSASRLRDFEVGYGVQGQTVMSDVCEAHGIYVVRVTDTARYSAHFASALAWRLAAELAPVVIGAKGTSVQANIMERAYPMALSLAGAHAANQSHGSPPQVTPSLAARL